MSYNQNAYLLASHITENTLQSNLVPMLSRITNDSSTVFKNEQYNIRLRERKIKTDKNKQYLICATKQDLFGESFKGAFLIKDEILASRIIEYLQMYHGKKKTNCSTLAKFLYGGKFVECSVENDKHNFMFDEHMMYYSGQKISSGDVLCFFYYKHVAQSRKIGFRKHYRKMRRKIFTESIPVMSKKSPASKEVHSYERVMAAYRSGMYNDYHFMICIGHYKGKEVFIQQVGCYDPKADKPRVARVVVTFGVSNLYFENVPSLTLIKRNKK